MNLSMNRNELQYRQYFIRNTIRNTVRNTVRNTKCHWRTTQIE